MQITMDDKQGSVGLTINGHKILIVIEQGGVGIDFMAENFDHEQNAANRIFVDLQKDKNPQVCIWSKPDNEDPAIVVIEPKS